MPPSDDKFPDEEPATQPDLMSHRCPHCRGAGGFLVAVEPRGHRSVTCAYCKGKRRVSAAQNRSYLDQNTPPHGLPKAPSSRPKPPPRKGR